MMQRNQSQLLFYDLLSVGIAALGWGLLSRHESLVSTGTWYLDDAIIVGCYILIAISASTVVGILHRRVSDSSNSSPRDRATTSRTDN